MYDLVSHANMIAFEERTSAYACALHASTVPGAVVLDIGAGTGILSFLACRAGAVKVYAVESEDVIQLARDLAADNNLLDRIEFIQALTTEIDLPEMVDGIVASIHGVLPPYGKSIVSIVDARNRFLKPEGWIIPARDNIWAALSCCPEFHCRFTDAWDTEYDFDFKKARSLAVNSFRATRLDPEGLVAAPQCWAILDYKQVSNPNIIGDLSWLIDRSVTAHGVSMWFDSETSPGFGFSNSPAVAGPHVFNHAFFPWPEAVKLMAGDQVQIRLRADFADSDYLWSWNTYVTSAFGKAKARYTQSTFLGTPLASQRLHKRGASFVPVPNKEFRIDYKVLDLMRRKISLDEIAKALLAEFPERFTNWNAAHTRAADLSEKYSK